MLFVKNRLDETREGARPWLTKSRKIREVPMTDELHAALAGLPRRIRNPYVFASPWNRREGEPISYATIQDAWRRLLERTSLDPGYRPHDLRHTFGTDLARRGVDVRTIADLMGHSDIRMTMKYLHTDRQRKRDGGKTRSS